MNITEIAGWIPAVVLPVGTLIQLFKIVKNSSIEGVSVSSWFLFGLANIGLYIFTEKYFAIQSLVGLLGTALMDFIIVALLIVKKK
ncbi:MAG: hypothetical protein JXR91_09945 [Deltaproteobacteria bacterium]|nr:hypothetical protein [Deltaproteobacteria bacterium]